MQEIEIRDGPVHVNRRRLLEAIEGVAGEVIVVRQAGSEEVELIPRLRATAADLVCLGEPFTEAVKRIRPVLEGVDRSDLLVPRLPVAARLEPLRTALEESVEEEVSLAEIVATRGGVVVVLPA